MVVGSLAIEVMGAEVPNHRHAPALRLFIITYPVLAVACGLLVGVVPQYVIYRVVIAHKWHTRQSIMRALGDLDEALRADPDRVKTFTELLQALTASANLPVRTPWLVPMTAALIGPLIAFLLAKGR
jgi:hypothetical protein